MIFRTLLYYKLVNFVNLLDLNCGLIIFVIYCIMNL
jgi:hypothetical protein